MSNVENLMGRIFSSIENDDIKLTRTLVDELQELVLHDRDSIGWILQPVNITKFHTAIMQQYEIPRKMLMLRNRVPSAHRRAVMFIKAIANGLRRADEG
jgi:hypothetical protein